jgi:hypothetical protein
MRGKAYGPPSRDKTGRVIKVCAYMVTAAPARRLGMLNPRHSGIAANIQPNMHRMQPTLFSILHITKLCSHVLSPLADFCS